MATTFQATSPIDGQSLGKFAVATPKAVQIMMANARTAGANWSAVDINERCQILSKFKPLVLAELDAICNTISRTTGKVMAETLLGEIYPVLELVEYYRRHAAKILRDQGVVTSPYLFPEASAKVMRQPYGVVAVISPWNYPFQITVCQIVSALFAGNAVIFKLSEYSLPVGKIIIDLFAKLELPNNAVQWLIGDGNTGTQLLDAAPDLVVFTGSLNTGRAVMQRAAQHPIPVILELGGKDVMIVFADADLERAVKAAVYGAFCNSGQACVSVERLYVQQNCYESFRQQLCAEAAKLQISNGETGDLGPMTSRQQADKVKAQYDDAIAKGAKISAPLTQQGNYLNPVILWDVTPDMLITQEETFGPLLAIIPFADESEAIRLANQGEFGLNASVWSRDLTKAERVARQLTVGNWAINDVIKNIGHPRLPFGGCQKSGFGRYRGAEGLRQFTYPVSGLTSQNPLAKEPNWFPYSKDRYLAFKGYLDLLHGEGNLPRRIKRNWTALQAFREYSGMHLRQQWLNLKLALPWNRGY